LYKFRCFPTHTNEKNEFQLDWGYIFCGILDPAAVQGCTIFPSLITDVPQLVRDIININGACYQRYEKHLEQ